MNTQKFGPNFILLYVSNPRHSAAFYASLLGSEPLELSDTFAMFATGEGQMLGLWARETVSPSATAAAGAAELAMTVDTIAAVDTVHRDWTTRGYVIAQPPCQMDFGYTFTAQDPDGHRLRVFVPSGH